jgi:S1/P1 Nuclease
MRTFLSAFLLALLTSTTAYPWGAEGHAAIGLIAEQRLTPEARAHIEHILGNDNLAAIASWMDDLRGASRGYGPLVGDAWARELNQRFPDNAEWHFVDMPLGESGYTDHGLFSRPDDVVHQINLAVRVLEGKSTIVSPRLAIYMIVHFVGDEHQPLHVTSGYYDLSDPSHPKLITDPKAALGRQTDKGGNDLVYGPGRWEELHPYWDTGLPEKVAGGSKDPAVLAKALDAVIPAGGWTTPGNYHEWAERWATGSLIAARQAYAGIVFGPAEIQDGKLEKIHITLPADYDATAVPLAREQLAKAGVHLADLLNAIHWAAGS